MDRVSCLDVRIRYLNAIGDRTKEGSSGLGLSIAQQVIKQHFGTITASNRECGGAEFLILFPQMDATTIY